MDDRFLLFFAVSGESPLSLSPTGKVLPDDHPLKRAAGPLGSLLDYSYWLVSSLQLGGCLLAIRGWRREDVDARPGSGVALLIGAGYLVLAAAACHAAGLLLVSVGFRRHRSRDASTDRPAYAARHAPLVS